MAQIGAKILLGVIHTYMYEYKYIIFLFGPRPFLGAGVGFQRFFVENRFKIIIIFFIIIPFSRTFSKWHHTSSTTSELNLAVYISVYITLSQTILM